MRKTLYLIRHAETLFNTLGKIQGWCDSPLTEHGQKQAEAVGAYFERHGITFDHAYSSTSERCCDTLERITDLPYIRKKGLKEMNYGILEGESTRLGSTDPEECRTYYLRFNGESSDTVRDRMTQTLTEIMEKEDHLSVLAVSHGGACFNFLRGIQDPSPELKKGFPNCTVFVYEYKDHVFTLCSVIRDFDE